MKLSFQSSLATYVFIRILLCTIIISLFLLGIGPFITNMAIRVAASIVFSASMCFYSSMTIARYVKDLIAAPLFKVLKSAQLLSQASSAMNSVAKGLSRNADIMVEFTDLLDGMAEVCDETVKECNNEIKASQDAVKKEYDDMSKK